MVRYSKDLIMRTVMVMDIMYLKVEVEDKLLDAVNAGHGGTLGQQGSHDAS